jgi:hypothetical protein
VAGVLDVRWAAWFGGLQISGEDEETVICGLVADQSALHGPLTKVRDLGLCLISGRIPTSWKICCRVIATLTGCFNCRAASNARIVSAWTSSLEPNPPPM